jgi:hypothetical protein
MANKENIILVKTKVYIDSMPDKVYDAYIEKDVNWNGWVCPWFTKEIVEEILTYLGYEWYYHSDEDSFEFKWLDDNAIDVVFGQNKTVNKRKQHLYPLGNKSWIWDEFETKKKTKRLARTKALEVDGK